MVGFFDGREYSCFPDFEAFCRHCLTAKYSGWHFFAHYGGRFDIEALFDWLKARKFAGYDLTFYCAGSCIVAFTLSKGPYHWRFSDSFRLMDRSLHKLTHEFEVEHKKLPFAPESMEYNRNDCMGLYEVLTKFFGVFSTTADTVASFAMSVFRSGYLKNLLSQPSRIVEDFIRAGYFGGRCEIFRWDEAELSKMDVNSLYPFAMMGTVPVEFIRRTRAIPDDDRRIGFYWAEVSYPESYLPVLPALIHSRLFFPVGRFRGVFSSMELREADRDGAAIRVIKGCEFEADSIFGEFVDEVFKLRVAAKRAGDEAKCYVYKKVMNSLYGKFGEGREKRVFILDPGTAVLDPLDESSPKVWPYGVPGSGIAYYLRESKSPHILPHISAAITSRARLITREWLRRAGRIWYTDTDSIFTDTEMPESLDLGALKCEGKGRFRAYGLKEYRFDGRYNVKGVEITKTDPVTGQKTEHPEIAESYLAGDKVSFMRRAGFLESMRKGEPTFRTVKAEKTRKPRIEKRARVGDDTRPWRAEELYEL